MKKFVYKLIKILPILLTLALVATPMAVSANDLNGINIGNVSDPTGGKINTILGYIQFFGIAVALGMLIVIGIKYVIADNADKQADIKNSAINYVFGAFCIFGAVAILQLVKSMVTAIVE